MMYEVVPICAEILAVNCDICTCGCLLNAFSHMGTLLFPFNLIAVLLHLSLSLSLSLILFSLIFALGMVHDCMPQICSISLQMYPILALSFFIASMRWVCCWFHSEI